MSTQLTKNFMLIKRAKTKTRLYALLICCLCAPFIFPVWRYETWTPEKQTGILSDDTKACLATLGKLTGAEYDRLKITCHLDAERDCDDSPYASRCLSDDMDYLDR